MQPINAPVILAITVACVAAIAVWVWLRLGRSQALVMIALSTAALACWWIAYEVLPVELWREGNLPRTLAVYAVPAAAALVITLLRARRRHQRLSPQAWGWLAALWLGPSLLIYISQLRPFTTDVDPDFGNSMWWAGTSIAIYVTIPIVYAVAARQRIRDYGLSVGFLRTEAKYLLLIVPVVALLVFLFSAEERFQQIYPFYDWEFGGDSAWLKLLIFEVAYGLSFVALEFFFRGFLVFAGYSVVGAHSVPMMAFTYCMLHLGKPMPECASSLIGGLLLGYVALRFRSIFVGVAAHLTMAWGMDSAVLWRAGGPSLP